MEKHARLESSLIKVEFAKSAKKKKNVFFYVLASQAGFINTFVIENADVETNNRCIIYNNNLSLPLFNTQ